MTYLSFILPPEIVFSQNCEFPKIDFTFWNNDLLEYQAFSLVLLSVIF